MLDEYFRILGIKNNCSSEDIKAAWKNQCKAHHPDRGGDENKFKEVMHAYKMITDASYRHAESQKAPPMEHLLRVHINVPVTFEDAFFGRKVIISFNINEINERLEPVVLEKYEVVTLSVDLPAGSVGGFLHVAEGKGLRLKDQVGDAHITFNPAPHSRYRMEGLNVVTEERIPLEILLKGGKIEVLTLYGIKTLVVPPGTRPKERLKIKKCGVMQKGAHYVLVEAIHPGPEDLKKGSTWKPLNIDWNENMSEADPEEQMYNDIYSRIVFGGKL